MTSTHLITLDALSHMPVEAIAALQAGDLARLQTEADEALRQAKLKVACLERALDVRYKARAHQARAEHDKDTGTVRFEDNGVLVVCDLPKRVKWNQQRLRELVDLIASSWGEDPTDYIKIKYDVSERAYEAWPARLTELFAPARTVETGKPSYALLPADGRPT